MSKLERQLDEIKGVKRVAIIWPMTEEMYLQQLREMLRNEISSHSDRIPLDLRAVSGAPQGLVDLLMDMKQYAESKGKQLVVTHALHEMRVALDPRRKVNEGGEPDEEDASEKARELLHGQLTTIQSFHLAGQNASLERRKPNKIRQLLERISDRANGETRLRRYLKLAIFILVGTAIVGVAEWIFVFKLSDDSHRFRLDPSFSTSFED